LEKVGVGKIKERFFPLISDKYIVIESEYEEPSTENDGCVSLYGIYPKEYTEVEKKYLDSGSLEYCEDIHTVVLGSQIGEVRYDSEEELWFYYDENDVPKFSEEKKIFGNNIVTITETWGSHHSWDVYIVRVGNGNEAIILFAPTATRIRCEVYDENGVESWDEECIEFLSSMNIYSAGNAWIFEEIYVNYYKDLVEILKDI
jgi:hypothetical protein